MVKSVRDTHANKGPPKSGPYFRSRLLTRFLVFARRRSEYNPTEFKSPGWLPDVTRVLIALGGTARPLGSSLGLVSTICQARQIQPLNQMAPANASRSMGCGPFYDPAAPLRAEVSSKLNRQKPPSKHTPLPRDTPRRGTTSENANLGTQFRKHSFKRTKAKTHPDFSAQRKSSCKEVSIFAGQERWRE